MLPKPGDNPVTQWRCDECGVGRYRLIAAPYLVKLGKQMMVMPDAPAYVCDICGFRCFDDHFLASMQYLIRQAANDSRRRTRKRQPTQQPEAPALPPLRHKR